MEAIIAFLAIMFAYGVAFSVFFFAMFMVILGLMLGIMITFGVPMAIMYLMWLACTAIYRQFKADEGVQHKQG